MGLLLNVRPNVGSLFQGNRKRSGNRLGCQIIRSWSKPTGDDQHARALRHLLNQRNQAIAVVADNGLAKMGEAKRGKLLRQPAGVAVKDVAKQKLRPYTENFNTSTL